MSVTNADARIAELERALEQTRQESAQTIEQLRQRNELLLHSADLVSLGIWECDVAEGEIYWSKGVFEIYGLPVSADKPTLEVALSYYAPTDRLLLKESLESLMLEQKSYDLECQLISADGQQKVVRVIGRVGLVEDGAVARVFGVIQDITRSYRLRKDMQAYFELTPDLVGAINFEGYPSNTSLSWEATLGYTPEVLKERGILEVFHPDDRADMAALINQAGNDKGILRTENRVITSDGEERWYSWRLFVDEATQMIFVSAHDMTESKRAEAALIDAKLEAEKASQSKSDFLAVMSHELRTPLNPILGFTEMLMDETEREDHREVLQLISQAGQNLNGVIGDVLDFAKIESGRVEVLEDSFVVRDVFMKCIGLMQGQVDQKRIDLNHTYTVASGLSEAHEVLGDPDKIGRVLTNLVSNAIKFTVSGSVLVEGHLQTVDVNRAQLRVSVMDTGIGIAEEDIEELFSPFKQLDSSKTRRFGGTGLGLAICKKLVDFMGGGIEVQSEHGVGSTFTFWVPLQYDSTAAEDADIANKPLSALSLKSAPNILLVEDNSTNVFYARRVLSQLGCSVSVAGSGEEALAQYSMGAFDLILLDLHMPGIGGLDALKRLREKERASKAPHVPVLILTADVLASSREACIQAGANGFLSKPVHPSDLYSQISQLLPAEQSA